MPALSLSTSTKKRKSLAKVLRKHFNKNKKKIDYYKAKR
jgi:hypothetical protein